MVSTAAVISYYIYSSVLPYNAFNIVIRERRVCGIARGILHALRTASKRIYIYVCVRTMGPRPAVVVGGGSYGRRSLPRRMQSYRQIFFFT